ncbi:amidohydrolase family protein [Novosphingobium terrae]|uniref:amidohydrolase family protein n=1 Tax=Novosphingobium terrae TaxID=2726189 RepID=UPI00197DF72D|nr:amidohydrolase family protein [Novosphingobium terrae]
MLIDAHHHLWTLQAPGHIWPTPAQPAIHRDYAMEDFATETAGAVTGSILVQAQPCDSHTDWLLEQAARHDSILGVVGWAQLDAVDAPMRIARLALHPKLVGLRPMLQDLPEDDWILRPEVEPGLAAMVEHGLRFDALITPRHLPVLAELALRWPMLPMVIDHGGKPDLIRGTLEEWRAGMARLAASPQLFCKLSGLRTEQAPESPPEQLEPVVETLLDLFPNRLMWGSDWPVLHMSGDRYADWLNLSRRLTQGLDDTQSSALFGATALRFYGLG